jgi:hypothetical protein
MLPDKQSGKKPFVLDNYLFAPDNVRDRPLIFRLDIDSIMQGPIIVNGDSKGLKKLADECESLKKTLKVMYSDSETSSIIKKRKSPPNFQDLTLLPNLFGENIVTNRVLPLGFTSMETPRNPNR